MRFQRSITAVFLLWLAGPLSAADRILFIGNSLTYAHDLPAMVCALAAAEKRDLRCESVTRGGFSLEDHWNEGNALKRIREGGWTWVVLQQGPSAARDSRGSLLKYARMFDREIRKKGARTVVYQVWPSMQRAGDFDRSLESYALAADETGGLLVPVGRAFREAAALDVPVFEADQFHPTVAGSYLGALVFHRALFGADASQQVIGFESSTRRKMVQCVEKAFE
jgi:hypothetical protein